MKKKGFTLIELLIVIAIIGILAVAFLPSLLGAPAKGRDAQRLATVQKISNFIVSKMLTGTLDVATKCIADDAEKIGTLIKTNIADFGGAFPKDPQTATTITGADPACADGKYGFIKFGNAANKYSYAVYAKVEIRENANIGCEEIDDDGTAIVLATPAADKPACYISLIQ